MPAPYSYLGGVQPVDLSPQVQSIAANLGAGLAAALQTSAAQQQAQLQAQQQAAMQAQLAEDMRDYAAAPSIEKFGLLLGRYPQMKKQLESVQSRLTEEDRQGALSFIAPTLSYLQGGQNDLAIESIKRRNEALANSSVPNRAALIANGNAMISAIERGDEGVNSAVGALIRDYAMASGTTDPAKFSELQAELPFAAGYAKGRVAKQEAETKVQAEKAKEQAIRTGFAAEIIEAGIAKDLAQATNYAAMADVAREKNRIEWYKAQLQKAKNEADAENARIQIREGRRKLSGLLAEKKADLDLANATLNDAIELVNKIKAVPDDVRRAAHGPLDVRAPTFQQDVADYEKLVDTLKAKNFSVATKGLNMAGVAKAETDKLQDALGSLDLVQSVQQTDFWLNNIKSFSEKNKQILQDKFNAASQEVMPGMTTEEMTEKVYTVDF